MGDPIIGNSASESRDDVPLDEVDAFELVDAHLDQQDVTPEQAAALAAWLKQHPDHADRAFRRIFLHTFLRQRLQYAAMTPGTDLTRVAKTNDLSETERSALLLNVDEAGVTSLSRGNGGAAITLGSPTVSVVRHAAGVWWRSWGLALGIVGVLVMAAGWAISTLFLPAAPPSGLWVYEGFEYPPTSPPAPLGDGSKWPTTGGIQGSNGGIGWAEPWREEASKVSILVADVVNNAWRANDRRSAHPLAYADAQGRVLKTAGIQLRTAAGPLSKSARSLAVTAFPDSLLADRAVGQDGSVVWLSFLAQSFDGRGLGNFAYLQLGTDLAGLRIGKLASVETGNWSAAGVRNGEEVNAVSSELSSGQAVLFVARITFKKGEDVVDIWIDPLLDKEPSGSTAAFHVTLPDFRFDQISISSRYTSDFDEIRLGGTFRDVTPVS